MQAEKEYLSNLYSGYLDCLNRRDLDRLGEYVSEAVRYNGKAVGLVGYRRMLEADFEAIPDLLFKVDILVSDPPYVGARLLFDCTPTGELFGLPINGKRVSFTENVFYQFNSGKIEVVWSVIDKAAIQAQL